MRNKQIVIYDNDAFYATRLEHFLSEREGNYFEISSFSERSLLEAEFDAEGKRKPEILLVSERSFFEDIKNIGAKNIFVLNETGLKRLSEFANFNKYQSADALLQQVLLEYAEREQDFIPRFNGNKRAKIVGVYTPITRCLQTGFSFSLARSFGKKGRTLYMNFEQYSGFSKLFQKGYIKDLSDLVYYFSYSKDKFLYWLEGVVERFGNIDYIPPVLTPVSLLEISENVWIEMLELIAKDTDYDYIVLDLSDSVQGIYQILDLCQIVYTITRDDVISNAKITQFEQMLEESKYASLKEKIEYLRFPVFGIANEGFEEMVHGELQEYTERLVEDNFYE